MKIGDERHEGRIQFVKVGHWHSEGMTEFGEEDEYSIMGRVSGYDLSELIKVDLYGTNCIIIRRNGLKVLREDGNFIKALARHKKLSTKKHFDGWRGRKRLVFTGS